MTKLITTDELITRAKNRGVDFGKGSPKIHLSYLSSLGLIPPALKRKFNDQITGCYDETVLNQIEKIETWKKDGLTYSQIKIRLENEDQSAKTPLENLKTTLATNTQSYIKSTSAHNLVFLAIGLILGYLIALGGKPETNRLNNPATIKSSSQILNSSTPPVDDSTSEVLTILNTSKSSNQNAEPLYLIAIPKQNLERIGKTTILNLLNN